MTANADGEPPMRVVILCAGASRRLGEPKGLARLGDRAGVDWLLDAASSVDSHPIVVVGRHAQEIRAHLGAAMSPAEPIENALWEAGRTGSVACAAQAAPDADLLIAPADVPLVDGTLFQALAKAWCDAGAPSRGWLAPWTRPSLAPGDAPRARRHGHPIVLGRDLAAAIRDAADPARPLSEFRAQAEPLLGIEVHDEAIHDDLDTPQDLSELRARIAERLGDR